MATLVCILIATVIFTFVVKAHDFIDFARCIRTLCADDRPAWGFDHGDELPHSAPDIYPKPPEKFIKPFGIPSNEVFGTPTVRVEPLALSVK